MQLYSEPSKYNNTYLGGDFKESLKRIKVK